MSKAFFITFEGGEGSGKSTQLRRLAEKLTMQKIACITTREPGGTPGAEKIRALLVTGDVGSWNPVAETLLFTAARSDHIERVIKPAIEQGTHVLCDRYSDSTVVYQGIAKKLGEAYVRNLQHAAGEFVPDLTLIFDIAPEEGLKRAGARAGNETRFESLPLEFHREVRQGFLTIAREAPQRCAVIDALGDQEVVAQRVQEVLETRLGWSL